ncbi:response regulator transcription factor [Pseudoalteromonas sp. MM17-2]|uniref:response regulator n=1 Tax=Pseudoalteromonas sp. MM17-2 TaxID=2917753 RepID=UPI001EF4837B|nr:response regulator transcription factor [Pseudoalteromonas sp. MM17-2]MCG7543560.1 response regulator transcription factor [Pseudoalteromonas sp. MM17-2]
MQTTAIKVHLVDDQHLVRAGLASLLALDKRIQVSGESVDGQAFLECYQQGNVDADVILLDVRMPRLDGIGVLQALSKYHAPPCLILTTFNDSDILFRAIEHNAKGFMLKDASLEELVAGITALSQGGSVLQQALKEAVMAKQRSVVTPQVKGLTAREQQILELICAGYANKEIAAKLHKAPGTIRNAVSTILTKLEVRDRTQATIKAIELGLYCAANTPSD